MESFYTLPVPKLTPGVSTSYRTTHYGDLTVFGIPASAIGEEKLLAITTTMEMLAKKSHEIVTLQYYNLGLQTRFNQATEEYWGQQSEMLDTIRASVTHDLAHLYSYTLDTYTNNVSSPAQHFRISCAKSTTNWENLQDDWQLSLDKMLTDMMIVQ